MEILNRKAIKQQAREFIGVDRRWLYMALACLPLTLIQGAINGGVEIVQRFSEDGEMMTESYNYSSGTSVVAWLLIPFTIGMAGYFLNHLRGANPDWKSLYREGIDNYGTYFKVGVVTDIFVGLWTLLFIIPGIIKGLEWSFVHQIIHDNPNLDGKQARDLSKRMTNGFKGEIFVMELSFILWYLLVAVTFGIAALYVTPYVSCTTAMYYENLKHNALVSGVATPDEFGILPVVPEENGEYNAEVNAEPPVLYSYIERDLETNVETVVEEQVVEESAEETVEEIAVEPVVEDSAEETVVETVEENSEETDE